jgi:diguanylate cyclase (GGDEF)-like protein/PAS domain S-box-containing protein
VLTPTALSTRVGAAPLARPLVIVTSALAAAGAAALLEWESDAGAATAFVALVAGVFGVRLTRQALRLHRAGSDSRVAGLLALGALAIAATAAVSTLMYTLGAGPENVAYVTEVGLAVITAAYVPALLLMPGAATSLVARLRRFLDGISLGACLLFITWMLVVAPSGRLDSVGLWVAVVLSCMLSLAVVTALRAGRTRPAALFCAAGVAATVVGLSGLAFALSNNLVRGWPSVFSVPLVIAPVLMWHGSRRGSTVEEPRPPDRAGTFAGYPILALPVAATIAIVLHRTLIGEQFGQATRLLGIFAFSAIALRESLAALDVSRYARRLAEQEARFRTLVAGSTDVIMVLDDDLMVRWQSSAAARHFGLSDQEVVGRCFLSMLHPDDAAIVGERIADVRAGFGAGAQGDGRPALAEARLRDGFGRWRETESSITDQRDAPEVDGLVVHIRDVGERREMERTLHRLSYADQLTGLANRRQLMLTVVALRSVPGGRGALIRLELMGFTGVNDVRGYDIGDAVLIEVARRLRTAVGESDLPARLSGDEFAVVTEASPVQAYALANRLLTVLSEPIVLAGVTVHLTASIGLTDLAGCTNGDDVMRRADLALRRAKQLGRGRVEWYDEAVEEAIVRRDTLEQELPDALLGGQLDLIYQPILDLVADQPLAVEALLRWRHPRLHTLLPVDIIPVAETLGLIDEIGSWVLRQACRQLVEWRADGRDLSMAVNVSPLQLDGPGLAVDVAAALDLYDLPADRLVIEVAEGGLGTDTGAACEQLGVLRSLGVRIALDDFGAGPASLTHLRRLPMDLVKIGPSFFDSPSERPNHPLPIIDVMVGLGRRLGIEVAAEGLEVPSHLDVVRAAGCRIGQGHLLARPQPAEHVEAYLDGFPARSV